MVSIGLLALWSRWLGFTGTLLRRCVASQVRISEPHFLFVLARTIGDKPRFFVALDLRRRADYFATAS